MRVRMAARYSASPSDCSHNDLAVLKIMGCIRSYLALDLTLTRGRMRVSMAAGGSASPRDCSHNGQAVVMVMGCTRSYLDKRKNESAHGCQVLSVPQ